ncbi:MAG: hypothetical protein K0S68_1010, partial [Candidatus Saccharibacteria bacterium]|nr:hypothetical protein [Candidatus Saccharibacteria bacterium]
MEPLDYDTVEALQAAQRGLRTEATLYLGRPSHAYTESKRFRENVAALVAYLEYDAKRRKRALSNGGTGAPQWSDDRWKKHRLQM